jgi:ADP-ribose pyrophosphatase YjhB (NUDIX family)
VRWAQELQTLAQAGLTYGKDEFDLERYRSVQRIAAEINATHSTSPIEEVTELLTMEPGYVTPKVDVRAAVFDRGRILIVKEISDDRWSLPSGWADCGESAAEVTEREVHEEAGLEVRATKVLAVLDRSKQGHTPQLYYCYKIFFRCEVLSGELKASHETPDVGWFDRSELPPLSLSRVTEAQMRRMFEHHDRPDLPTDYD